MRTFALESSSDNASTRKKRTAVTESLPAPFKLVQPGSAIDGPMLQRKSACACGGGCPRCQGVQPKLSVSVPGDQHEQEADRIADQVMQAPASEKSPELSAHGKPELKRARDRVAQPVGKKSERPAGELVSDVMRSRGEPLGGPIRQFMETRFGRSFEAVRIHTNAMAAESAQAMGARAYTLGNNVVFAEGNYDPTSAAGQKLVAHELAHTVQQNSLPAPAPQSSQPALIQRQADETESPVDSGATSGENSGATSEENSGTSADPQAGGEASPMQTTGNDISRNSEPESCTFGNRSLPYAFTFGNGMRFWSDVFSLGSATSVSLSISASYDNNPNIANPGNYCAELFRCRGADFFPPYSGGSALGQQCRQIGTSGTMSWSGLNKTYGHFLKIWKGGTDGYTMKGSGTAS